MNEFIIDNKEVLSICTSLAIMLLSLAFGGILAWRHKICLEYESQKNVAISILNDRFVQRTSVHYSDIEEERERDKTSIEEIYKRPGQQQLVRELGRDLEDQNRVKRYFRWLVKVSGASFGFLWAAIILIVVAVALLWAESPFAVWVIWLLLLGTLLVGFFSSITAMWMLDGRFFKLVHRVIEPEGE
ncbi:hypothetical protein CEE37_04665 [candidate division LCP-89 bacterium B3_LCP]|uniref:DUF2721 domain-containing protein n=1 Tax=candidate division LCP-89 bacterium B3_LCP TaxID=2012998 RepID=A0A532V3U8_UNCL8|nr:MAG: hypothetical protein CEE37_04665 [candidate division LCP-89 bacterium B3_LCP]